LNEWVDIKIYDRIIRGFILDESEAKYLVERVLRFHPDGSVDQENGKQWFHKSDVAILDDTLHEEDVSELVDLALDHRQFEWIGELKGELFK
jgi:hypothetical protein